MKIKSIASMRKFTYILVIILGCGSIKGQHITIGNKLDDAKARTKAIFPEITKDVYETDFSSGNLFSTNTLSITFGVYTRDFMAISDLNGNKNESWFGEHSIGNQIVLLKEQKVAWFQLDFVSYLLYERDGVFFVSTFDYDVIAKTPLCGFEHTHVAERTEIPQLSPKGSTHISNFRSNDVACDLRILNVYTQAVLDLFEPLPISITDYSNLLIDQLNLSFYNSNISANAVLASTEYLNFTENNGTSPATLQLMEDDLGDLVDSSDGRGDEVHVLREHYLADYVVLLGYGWSTEVNNSAKGIASNIKACFANAFAVINVLYAIPDYTYTHEIGHLAGCKHQYPGGIWLGPNNYFGHGYVFPFANAHFGTVMSITQGSNYNRVLI